MRRATSKAGLSPKQLKHFAGATVVTTALLALFASGEDWGAQAQIQAVDAKNQLAATEAEKLGTRKITAKLKVRSSLGGGSMGLDDGPGSGSGGGGGGGGGGSLYPDATRRQPFVQPGYLPPRPAPAAGQARVLPPGAQGGSPAPQAKPQQQRQPSDADLEALLEASRQRSGGSDSGD